MARKDRLKQGAEAKARVLSGVYNQPRQTEATPSRRDRLKPPVDVNNPMSMTQTIYGVRNALEQQPQQQPVQAMRNNEPGLLMNKVTPNAPLSAPNLPKQSNDRSALSKVGEFLSGVRSGATFGVGDWLEDKLADVTGLPANERPDTGYSRGGEFVGTLLPGSKAGEVAHAIAAPIKNTVGRIATRGAIGGGLYGLAREGAEAATGQNDQTLGQRAKDVAIDTGLGVGAELGLSALGKGVSSIVSRLRKNGVPDAEIDEILSLPMGTSNRSTREAAAANRLRGGLESGEEAITPDYTFRLEEPSAASLEQQKNVRTAGYDLSHIESQIKQLEDGYEKAVIDEYKYLRESMKNRKGFRQGNVTRNAEGEVNGRYGRISDNPLWYRELYAEKNRVPSLKRLYEAARQRVDNGFRDESGAVTPAWKERVNYDETLKSLNQVRDQLRASIREGSNNYGVTETPLKSSELSFSRKQRLQQREPIQTEQPVASSEAPRATPEEAEVEQLVQKVSQPRIRDRVYNFLDEQEQAARKRMATRRGNLSANPLPEWGDMSIIMAAKMGKGTITLADFTEAAVKEFGESVRSKAPKLFQAAKEEVRRQERRASKEGQAADTFNNSGQGDANSFASKISYKPTKNKSSFSQKVEKIRSQFVDDLAALEGLEKRVTGRVASAENSLYKSARLSRGIPERANLVVQQRLTPLVDAVEKAGYTADDLGKYALARHAKDVNAAGYKSGFTNKEIDDVLNKYANVPAMEEARQGLVQVSRDMLQELADSGVVSKELQSVLNERWKNYVPLYRAFDEELASGGFGSADKLANIASPVKALKGSERKVINPLENMVKNVFQSVNAAERNKVAQQLSKLAEQDPESKFIRKLDPGEKVDQKNVVNVKENGENVSYEVEPAVKQALLNLDKESSNMIINILSKPASLLRAGATLTPEFSLRNPMRDILQAFVTSKSGFNPLIDFPAGLISTITKGKDYQGFVNNLGAYGNVMSMDRKVHADALKKVLGEKPSEKFINIVNGKGLIRLLRSITDATESATKVGEYRAALRQGQTPQEAAYRARDLMDFARSGSGVRQANKMVAFLNANIQGKSKLLRAIKDNPVKVTTKALASVTIPTVAAYMINDRYANEQQKSTINDAPDWLKDSFWLIAVPGTNTVARIPKPFDLAPIFANLPERALKYTQDNDPQAFDGYARQTLASGALPYQISGLLPFIEGMSNYSFFRGSNIIPKREEGLEFKDQYDPTKTTEAAKAIAALSDAVTGGKGTFKNFSSPRIVDNTIQGLTAGLGGYATSAIDSILSGNFFGQQLYDGIVDRPVSPEKRLEQQPFVKAFTVDPLTTSKSLDKLYTERDQLTREKGSAKLNDTEFDQSTRLKSLDKSADRISKIGKQIREIEASTTLSAAQKREQIEPLMLERNLLARNTMQEASK